MSGDFRTRFGLAVLATWRVTHLLAREDGPGDAVVRVRARLGPGWAGELMDCFQCLSLWVAAPLTVFAAPRRRETVPTWLALSGAACLLERWGSSPIAFEAFDRAGEGGGSDGMLRRETRGVEKLARADNRDEAAAGAR